METTLDSIGSIRLYQPRHGYRFSADPVLLGSFVAGRRPGRIADLGAGAGVVGLLLAARYPEAEVTLVELQDSLYGLLRKNVRINASQAHATALKADIRDLPKDIGKFDMVVSNPPFRKPGSGRLSMGSERAVARHELELTLAELICCASRILERAGRFCVVYHPGRLAELLGGLRAEGLEPKRMRLVHGTARAEAKMVLVEAAKGGRTGLKVLRPLIMYAPDGEYTSEAAGILAP